ncbi:MAG: hypothetical protein AAGJ40_02120 [Planctomycetota bacterium]
MRVESLLDRWSVSESSARRWLNVSSVVVGSLGLLGAAWWGRPLGLSLSTAQPVRMLAAPTTDSNSVTAVEDSIWRRSLRGGFRAVPQVSSRTPPPRTDVRRPAPSPTRANIGIRLVGTIVEPGRSIAIATDRTGRLAFHGEGESLALQPPGVTLHRITSDDVTVSFEGETLTMRVGELLQRPLSTNSAREVNNRQPDGPNMVDSINAANPARIESGTGDPPSPGLESFPDDDAFSAPMSLDEELDMLNGF